MRINDLQVDGFGVWKGLTVDNLNPGMTLFYGRNEAGKTTLMEFIRRMFFGAPRKGKGVNPYPPLNGGGHGGSVKCQLASQETCWVVRTFSGKGGVDISPVIAGLTGQPALDSILGHASSNIFQNIFAFTFKVEFMNIS